MKMMKATILFVLVSLFSVQAYVPLTAGNREATDLASSLAAPSMNSMTTRRDYFAQRIQESRNQAFLRSRQTMATPSRSFTTTKGATDNYFARRIEECRQRTLMVSLEAAKAARERSANAAGKRILFSPIRTPSVFYSAAMPH